MFVACSDKADEIIPEELGIKDVEVVGGTILKFKDQVTFNAFVANPENNVIGEDLSLRSSASEKPFKSLKLLYEEALSEAESYYDREGGYEEFKAKYPFLYFPEHEDDYSVYLPIANENIAEYANANGEIMIGNEVKNFKDIISYDQLVELGKTPSSGMELRANYDSGIINNRGNDNKFEYDSRNKRRLWVKARLLNNDSRIHVEISFRKKGFLGKWYNYSSATDVDGVLTAELTNLGLLSYSTKRNGWKQSGSSSHDYEWHLPYGYVKGISGDLNIYYQGWGETVRYQFKNTF